MLPQSVVHLRCSWMHGIWCIMDLIQYLSPQIIFAGYAQSVTHHQDTILHRERGLNPLLDLFHYLCQFLICTLDLLYTLSQYRSYL